MFLPNPAYPHAPRHTRTHTSQLTNLAYGTSKDPLRDQNEADTARDRLVREQLVMKLAWVLEFGRLDAKTAAVGTLMNVAVGGSHRKDAIVSCENMLPQLKRCVTSCDPGLARHTANLLFSLCVDHSADDNFLTRRAQLIEHKLHLDLLPLVDHSKVSAIVEAAVKVLLCLVTTSATCCKSAVLFGMRFRLQQVIAHHQKQAPYYSRDKVSRISFLFLFLAPSVYCQAGVHVTCSSLRGRLRAVVNV